MLSLYRAGPGPRARLAGNSCPPRSTRPGWRPRALNSRASAALVAGWVRDEPGTPAAEHSVTGLNGHRADSPSTVAIGGQAPTSERGDYGKSIGIRGVPWPQYDRRRPTHLCSRGSYLDAVFLCRARFIWIFDAAQAVTEYASRRPGRGEACRVTAEPDPAPVPACWLPSRTTSVTPARTVHAVGRGAAQDLREAHGRGGRGEERPVPERAGGPGYIRGSSPCAPPRSGNAT